MTRVRDCRILLCSAVAVGLIFLLLTVFFSGFLSFPTQFHYVPLPFSDPQVRNPQESLVDPKQNDTADQLMLINDFPSVWQAVPNRKTIVFSAYFDERSQPQPIIRVITESECQENRQYYCRLIFDSQKTAMVEGTKELINSDCSTIYDAHFILCPLPTTANSSDRFPVALQIFDTSEPSGGQLKSTSLTSVVYSPNFIRNSSSEVQYEHQLAVCIGRTWDWSDWFHFHFLVEFYVAEGATLLVFYHRSWSRDVDRLLRFYQRQKLVEIVPFPPAPKLFYGREDPNRAEDFIFQNLQVNDCSYWLRGRSKFVVNIDSDEFILPRGENQSLLEMLQRLDKQSDVDNFHFRNVVIYSPWPQTTSLRNSLKPTAIEHNWNDLDDQMLLNDFICSNYYYGKTVNKPDVAIRVSLHGVHQAIRTGNPSVNFVSTSEAIKYHLKKRKRGESLNITRKSAAYAPCVDNFFRVKSSPFKLLIRNQLETASKRRLQQFKGLWNFTEEANWVGK